MSADHPPKMQSLDRVMALREKSLGLRHCGADLRQQDAFTHRWLVRLLGRSADLATVALFLQGESAQSDPDRPHLRLVS